MMDHLHVPLICIPTIFQTFQKPLIINFLKHLSFDFKFFILVIWCFRKISFAN